MSKLLNLVSIKINMKMKKYLLATVTLNWQDEFEVRFCRLTIRQDGSLWFQPPALRDFGWVKCFVVRENDDWKELEQKVIKEFFKVLKEEVNEGVFNPELLERLEKHQENIPITDKDYEVIDKELT